MSMTQQQIDRYMALTQSVQELPALIAQAETELFQRKLDLAAEKKSLEQIGEAVVDAAILKAGGVKEFGSSEDIRKQNAKRVRAQSRNYVQQEQMVEACEVDVQRQTDLLSDLNRQYGAICFQITHHAALLQYLGSAGASAVQAQPYTWEMPTVAAEVDVAGNITAEDMEAIGL